MRNPRDFLKPLAIGAPDPLLEIPVRPSRMIHFLDFSNEKMVAKVPDIATKADILLGNLEDAVPVDRKEAAREGLDPRRARDRPRRDTRCGRASTRSSRRGCSTTSPSSWPRSATSSTSSWSRRSRGRGTSTTSTACSPSSRPRPASSGRSSSTRSSRPSLGVANLEEIATACPRMQGMSFGPADLAASRRMKTTRVGGGHPGYRVIEDPDPDNPEAPRATAQQDPWHYSIARMVDACTGAGILPFYGPFGDIKDVAGLRDAVPRRLPAGLRRRLVAAPGPDRHRQEGLLARPRRGRSSPRR